MTTTPTTPPPLKASCPHCGAANLAGGAFCESCGKALPSVSPTGPRVISGDAVPFSSAGHAMVSDQLKKEMRKASGALLAVAIIQTIAGAIFVMITPKEQQVIVGVVLAAIALLFWGLWFWSRYAPLPAAIVGLILFITIHALDALADPTSLVRGIIMKVIVIAVLCQAISAALKYRKLQESQVDA